MREIEKLEANHIITIKEVSEFHPESGKKVYSSNIFTLLHPDEWGKQIDVCLHEGSDTQSLGVRTDSHQPSDSESRPLVTPSHLNNTNLNNTQLTTESAKKPSRPPLSPTAKILVEETGKCRLNTSQLKETDKAVGNTQESLEKWRESVKAWNLNGNKPTDAAGMLDWFRTGKRSNYQPNGKDKPNGSNQQRNESIRRTGEELDEKCTYDKYTKELVFPDGHRVPAVS